MAADCYFLSSCIRTMDLPMQFSKKCKCKSVFVKRKLLTLTGRKAPGPIVEIK